MKISNRDNKIIYDRSKLKNPNANGFIFGKSGTGKEVYPENKEQIKPKRVKRIKQIISNLRYPDIAPPLSNTNTKSYSSSLAFFPM